MAITAKLRYLRIAPRKVRLVADLLRGKKVPEAQTLLHFLSKKASSPLFKLLKSAVASAKNNFQLDEKNLYISKITVDEGPKLKRWMPRARGRAYEIQKKTSHITLVLNETEKRPRKIKKGEKAKIVSGEAKKAEKAPKIEKPKLRPEKETIRPKTEKGIRKIFRRKSF